LPNRAPSAYASSDTGKDNVLVESSGRQGLELGADQPERKVLFRFYGPEKPLFDKPWKLPDVERIAAQ
jgi:hypothetical protein